jgi:hypothetical protein
MVLSSKMGVGAFITIPGKILHKDWALPRMGPHWKSSVIHGTVLEILAIPPRKKSPNAKVEIVPPHGAAADAPADVIIINLSQVKLVKPGPPERFISTQGGGAAAAATVPGAHAAAVAMDTEEDELDEEEAEMIAEERMNLAVERVIEARQKPPPLVTVVWSPWSPITVDHRAAAGYGHFNYSLPHAQFGAHTTHLDVFKYFLPLAMVNNAVRATNQTGHRKFGVSWEDIDVDAFMVFIAYWLAMGFHHESRAEFWREEFAHPIFNGHKFGRYGFSRNRFDHIVSALSFVPDTAAAPSGLEEVRAFQRAFNEHMEACYHPSWLVCVDESMTPWYHPGDCPAWVIIKDKPTQRGMEFHTTSDHGTKVIFRAELVRDPEATKFQNICSDVVSALTLRMVEPLFGSARAVVLDSFFGTLETVLQLSKQGLFSTIVLKKKRFWPALADAETLETKTDEGDIGSVTSRPGMITDQRGPQPFTLPVLEVGQKDTRRSCLVLSTWGTTNLCSHDGVLPQKRGVLDPLTDVVTKYKFFRAEVLHFLYLSGRSTDDLNNIRGGGGSLEHVWKTKSWIFRAFTYFLTVIEANSCNIYNLLHNEKLSLQSFRRELVKGMIPVPPEVAPAPPQAKPPNQCFCCTMPLHTRFIGGEFVTNSKFTKYFNRQCHFCHKRTRQFCMCNPNFSVCSSCQEGHEPF